MLCLLFDETENTKTIAFLCRKSIAYLISNVFQKSWLSWKGRSTAEFFRNFNLKEDKRTKDYSLLETDAIVLRKNSDVVTTGSKLK